MSHSGTLSLHDVWTRKLIYPGHTVPTALAPAVVAVGLAVRDGVFAPLPAFVAFLCGWLIQFAAVVTDNYENLVTDDLRDRHFDTVKGKHTVAVRFGPRWSRLEFSALLAFAYLVPFWLWVGLGIGPVALLPLLSFPVALRVARVVWTRDSFPVPSR